MTPRAESCLELFRPRARIDSAAARPGLNATGDPEDEEEEEEEEKKKPEDDEEDEENDGEEQEVPWQVAYPAAFHPVPSRILKRLRPRNRYTEKSR